MYTVKRVKKEIVVEVARISIGAICIIVKPGYAIFSEDGKIVTKKDALGRFYAESYRRKSIAERQCNYMNNN